MSRRPLPPAADPVVDEIVRQVRELTRELAGPKASFADIEMLTMAIGVERDARLKELAPPPPDEGTPEPPRRRSKTPRR
jgi:hypothetical protein